MDYELSDSSGTDDDLPPSHQNRVPRGGRMAGNGRSGVVGSVPYPRMHNDMETQIHLLEQEAYSSVLRAFKAQSNALSWEKESLITELRKELRVSDEEHRELLGRVNADDTVCRIREWRQAGGHMPGMFNSAQPVHDPVPSPTVSASRKKQKTTSSVPNLSLNAPSLSLHPQTVATPMQPSSSAAKRGSAGGPRGKKTKPGGQTLPAVSGMKSMPYPSTAGRGQVPVAANEPTEAAGYDPLIGRKVMTRWPEDNNFYEAVITNVNDEGKYALVYDINTPDETWEWVNLNEISSEDIRWEGGDPGISRRGGRVGQGRGVKKSSGRGGAVPGAGRGRGGTKGQFKKDFPPSENGIGRKVSDDIEILHTDTLIKEVERVFGASHPDPLEIEKTKKMLKEHEQSLIDAISRLADASDGESDEGEHPFSHGQSMDQDPGWRNYSMKQGGFEDGMRGRGEASDGDQMGREGRLASYSQQDGDDL
ncbi:hypothetical protein AQUCO_00900170v1 [Aquilegia coerulea]|uniref:ENT domain-containing protein n=1 Tax=Aquilegia coerulea TaxID=218851 RepID=A0A2G5ECW7_AQUCA|nr:hypothetical protein AQUCO_00900170v1 [Aquilegia coerulea]PIA53408.1 hypothetical protein AQUCO_00900170v1 [Aquilegia coerulea]PIA53409.1 hypothetical protein AQUCO_00900170v1 [Aquilegia coerulea]